MKLHKLLIRQLHKSGLDDYSDFPDNKKWQELVERISKTYEGMDQECYLLERSMNISSKEMKQLNQRLETAQHIARLGHWQYCKKDNSFLWSKELYNIFGFNPGKTIPLYEQFFKMIHEDDRPQLESLVERAFVDGKEYEYEIRVLIPDKTYHWFYIIGHPNIENNCLDGIAMDITKRKQAELEIMLLHKQLLSSARRAGMSEVATSILHNVGNILNSANVSTTLLKETLSQNHYKKLFQIINMMKDNKSSLQEYLFNDAKGKLILEYLFEISDILKVSYHCLETELDSLDNNLKHIKDIVTIQQSISGVSGITEKVELSEIINAALHMSDTVMQDKSIKIRKNYEKILPAILTDK